MNVNFGQYINKHIYYASDQWVEETVISFDAEFLENMVYVLMYEQRKL